MPTGWVDAHGKDCVAAWGFVHASGAGGPANATSKDCNFMPPVAHGSKCGRSGLPSVTSVHSCESCPKHRAFGPPVTGRALPKKRSHVKRMGHAHETQRSTLVRRACTERAQALSHMAYRRK